MVDVPGQSGGLVPHGGAARRRVLLPAEADLCNALNLSEAEYWYFVDLTDAYNGKRAEEYELAGVPDVENGFIVPIIISLVVGIAVSAIGMLLAPKPKAPQAQQQDNAGTLKTADNVGAKRFSANSSFDSVQDLASLGETIPLVFANRKDGVGGIRVKTLLLWSQLLSYGTGQQLKALMLLSAGKLGASPDFVGYSIGDQSLRSYTAGRLALYRRLNGGRIQEGDRYPEGTLEANPYGDVFSVYDDGSESYQRWFCGNRAPSTQAQFGLFSPMVNATIYRPNYELVMNQRDSDGKVKEDNNTKKAKLERNWRSLAGLEWHGGVLHYHIHGGMEDANAYAPWGLTDINNATEALRVQADDAIQLGGQYMAGTAQVICTSISTNEPWAPGIEKYYAFKIEQPGQIRAVDLYGETLAPYDFILQRLAIGTVSNNRACHVTEIGLKSTVWKQISGFPNVNSQPSSVDVADYENRNGTIQLGQLNTYVYRFSFFRLEVKKLGSTEAWQDITGGEVFCVRGNSPQERYNFIRIAQPFGQYEYRFVPVPGADVVFNRIGGRVRLLNPGGLCRYVVGAFSISYAGNPFVVTQGTLSNGEWAVGWVPPSGTGLRAMSPPSSPGAVPTYWDWVANVEERYVGPPGSVREPTPKNMSWTDDGNVGLWDGRSVGLGGEYIRGSFQKNGYRGKRIYSIIRRELRIVEKGPVGVQVVGLTMLSGGGGGATLRVEQFDNGFARWSVESAGTGYTTMAAASFTAFGQTFTANVVTNQDLYIVNNLNPIDAAADIGIYDAERFSHDDSPEHTIVYVNEVVRQDVAIPQYDGLAVLGLRLNASKEWSSFSQLSAYVKKGVEVERLIDDSGKPVTGLRASTNNFAEIAHALLTDAQLGAGSLLGSAAVNRERMTIAARFCRANGFTWDGVIADKLNLRSWIFEQAAYCLLDFTILGGQFSLVPSVPYTADFQIDNAAKPAIKALFTDGNIRNLKVSWLSPEERQLFKPVVKWRMETENGFPQERTLVMRFADSFGGNDYDPEEAFDLSGFCTDQRQAQVFSQYALTLRKTVDHGIIFETTPQAAMGLEPGQYFRFVSEATHTSRFNNGSINSEGFITSTTALADGTYDVLVWMPGTVGVGEALLGVKDGKALQPELFGQVFTIKNSTTTSRVYKLESLSYSSEGFVEVAGSYAPLTDGGTLAVLDWQEGTFLTDSF